jgi:hypothetical protein
MKKIIQLLILAAILICGFYIGRIFFQNMILQQVIQRLSADSRIAEVVVTAAGVDPQTGKTCTTIKFLEFDSRMRPLKPKYFTFAGNIIQFQAMVIRFDDYYVKKGDSLRGKSAYIFMKAFVLGDKGAEVCQINEINQVPSGYAISQANTAFEKKLWREFWQYALSPSRAKKQGVKNAQIEAPGSKFLPGFIYTIKIEHDGGIRIDAQPVPEVLKGEKID